MRILPFSQHFPNIFPTFSQHFPNIFPTFWGLSQHVRHHLQKSHRRGAMWLHHTLRLWQVCPKKLLRRTGELLSWKIMEKIGKQILTWLQVTKCMRSILILMPSRFGSVKSYELVHVDPKLGHPDAATGTTSRTIANVMCRGNPMVSYLYMICTCVQTYAITFVTRYTILYIYIYI